MPTSCRMIRTLNDEYTVEVEFEVDDAKDLYEELHKLEIGKKLITLIESSLEGVQVKVPQSFVEQTKAYEEGLREEGRKEILKEAKAAGIDLEKLLPKDEKKQPGGS